MSTYEFDPTRMAGSGIFLFGTAGEAIPTHNLVYLTPVAGIWRLADADLAATMPVLGLSMESAAVGGRFGILSKGFIGDATWAWATIGGEIYATGVPGIIGQVPPVAPSLTQVVGIATDTNLIYFDPTINALGGAIIAGLVGDYTYMVVRTGLNYIAYDNQGGVVFGPVAPADVVINAALAAGGVGCVIYLKEADTFVIDDPIAFTANGQVIRGGGRSTFIDGDALLTTNHAIELSVFDDCQIRNLSIQTQDGGGKTCHCIFIENAAHRFLIEDVVIVESDEDGIHIEGTTITGGEIRNCKVLGADFDGISVNMGGGQYLDYVIIEENTVTGCGSEGMALEDLRHGTINDNIVYGCTEEGIQLSNSEDCTMDGNDCSTNGFHGIHLASTDDSVVSNNRCFLNDSGDLFTYDGIHIDAGSIDNIINGNKACENHRYGIAILGTRNKATDNKCATNDRHGIYIAAGDCQINDNDCYDNGQDTPATYHEIYLTGDADQCTVHDNHTSSPGDSSDDCIHLANGAIDCTIMNNYCFNGMGSGIALTANNDDCSIIGNRCTDNDRYGIEIVAATCNDTRVKENHLEGNVTGQFLDTGTDTQTPWFFAPVSDPNHVLGRHPTVDMPVDTDTNVYGQILVPLEFQELVTCHIIVVSAGNGDLVWTVNTDYGKICATEDYNTHSDVEGATDTLVINDLECLDISGALDTPDIAGGDLVGVDFMRDGDNVADDIAGSVYYLGIRMRYV